MIIREKFKGNNPELFVDYHRWQLTTDNVQRGYWKELAENGRCDIPKLLEQVFISRLEYGGYKATSE